MLSIGAIWMPGWASSAQMSYGSPCPSFGFREVYRGRAEAREWIEQLLEVFEELHLEIDEIMALSDDRVLTVARVRGRGRGSSIPVERPSWEVVWLADGLITRRQVFWTRDEALEAAGLSE
jgi:ketosteroid isomerase-like protein